MGNNKKLGEEGEKLAVDYLEKGGWKILEKNYRHGRYEIDIIAQKENMMIFVEVKTRTGARFGFPEDFVDPKKQENVITAASHYIETICWEKNIRFDIISVQMKKGIPELCHFEDAFY